MDLGQIKEAQGNGQSRQAAAVSLQATFRIPGLLPGAGQAFALHGRMQV